MSEEKRVYVVMAFEKGVTATLKTSVLERELKMDVPLKWAPGMVGVLPVFESEEAAKEYAGEDAPIVAYGVRG